MQCLNVNAGRIDKISFSCFFQHNLQPVGEKVLWTERNSSGSISFVHQVTLVYHDQNLSLC